MPTRIKEINGNEYLYYIYYENGKKKDVYCGLASRSTSEKKALTLEIEQIKKQKRNLSKKVTEIESRIKSL